MRAELTAILAALEDVTAQVEALIPDDGEEQLNLPLEDVPVASVRTPEPVEPAIEPAPEHVEVQIQYAPTEKMGDMTIDDYIKASWTIEQLLEHGYVTQVESEAPPEATEEAPEFEVTELAQGASYDQLIANGWTHPQLVEHGLIRILKYPPVAVDQTWPQQNEHGQWFDAEGAIFDSKVHSTTKEMKDGGPPRVTKDGVFRKKRKKAEAAGGVAGTSDPAPTPSPAPPVAVAPEAPVAAAPPAPAPPAPTGNGGDMDPELVNIIKSFKNDSTTVQ